MTAFLALITRRQFQLTACLTLATIWLLGPYLAIGGTLPFATVLQRIGASALALIVLLIIERKREKKQNEHHPLDTSDTSSTLASLEASLQAALKTGHKNRVAAFFYRYQKPWYLVIGPSHSGKSTLLSKAHLNLEGLDNATLNTNQPFEWSHSPDGVFIDIKGHFLHETQNPTTFTQLFRGFFQLLMRYRPHKPINGIILTLHLQTLTADAKDQGQLSQLRTLLNELVSHFVDFPIYLILTRCDVIDGFVEFFENLGPEERQQSFGINFPLSVAPASLPQLFNEQFDAMLKRLNDRVIWRLQQEQGPQKIGKIKNFPLQMEFIKNPLAKLLNVILPTTHVNLRGIFFTSALQKDAPVDNLTKTLSTAYDIAQISTTRRQLPSKTFFIQDIFRRVIFPETAYYAQQPQGHRAHALLSLTVIGLTALCIFFFFNSYRANQQAIVATQHLIHATAQNPATSTPILRDLNLLQLTQQKLNEKPNTWLTKLGLQQASTLQAEAQKNYHTLLRKQFLPDLMQTLEMTLQDTREENKPQLYGTLATYLMLCNPTHCDKGTVMRWFENHWHQARLSTSEQTSLQTHLAALLAVDRKPLPLQAPLVDNARATLTHMPLSYQVLTQLRDQYRGSPVTLMREDPNNLFSHLPRDLSGIYAITQFNDVWTTHIANACRHITEGDWVLGTKAGPPLQGFAQTQLINEVRALYLTDYAATWTNVLTNIKMAHFDRLNDVNAMMSLMSDPQSPLIRLVTTVATNTQPLSQHIEFTHQVAARFLYLNTLATDLVRQANQGSLVEAKNT